MNDEFFDGFSEFHTNAVRREYYDMSGHWCGSHWLGSNLPGCDWFPAPMLSLDGYVVDFVHNF